METFLSSTFVDLVEHRRAATEALERLGQQVGRMEVFGAQPVEPKLACLSEVEACDYFVGVYAHRYGFVPLDSTVSITEQEFDHAQRHRKPTFCFVVREDHPWPPNMIEGDPGRTKLTAFKQRIGSALVLDTFTTPENLALKVAAAVGRYLTQNQLTPPIIRAELMTRRDRERRLRLFIGNRSHIITYLFDDPWIGEPSDILTFDESEIFRGNPLPSPYNFSVVGHTITVEHRIPTDRVKAVITKFRLSINGQAVYNEGFD
jgi:hypothetical protein